MVYMPYNEGEPMTKYEVIFYEKLSGECPVEEIVLTNGFVKKMQKTPTKEINLAKVRRKDFIERMSAL